MNAKTYVMEGKVSGSVNVWERHYFDRVGDVRLVANNIIRDLKARFGEGSECHLSMRRELGRVKGKPYKWTIRDGMMEEPVMFVPPAGQGSLFDAGQPDHHA